MTAVRKNPMRHLKSFVMAVAVTRGMAAPAVAQLRVTVVGEEYVPMRIAVPDFDASGNGAAEIAAQLSDVLRKDPGANINVGAGAHQIPLGDAVLCQGGEPPSVHLHHSKIGGTVFVLSTHRVGIQR